MRGFGRLAITVWLCAAVVLALALATFFATLEEVKTRLALDQLETLVNRVEGPAAARAALGYPLEYQADLQALVDSLSLSVKRGADIYILDAAGVVVFASEHERIGAAAPTEWLGGAPGSAEVAGGWTRETAAENVVGAAVVNAFGERSGTVVARALRRDVIIEVISAMRLPVIVGGLALAVAAVLAVAGTALATRTAAARNAAAAEDLEAAAAAVSAGKTPDAAVLKALPGLGDVLRRLRTVEEEVHRLDRSQAAEPPPRAASGPAAGARRGEAA